MKNLFSVLGSDLNRMVFKTIAQAKKISRFDLEVKVTDSKEYKEDDVEMSIEELKEAGLIEYTGKSDWDSVFVTSEGLSLQRELQNTKGGF